MIQRLNIRNYAIIEALNIDFSPHLTIITGETGAGKSILLGALSMILGERADTKVLYRQHQKCVIEGFFAIDKYDLKSFFEEHGIDYDPSECVIRRELSPSGKTRSFINDTPVNLGQLRQLTGALVDLHRQFDTLDIHEVSFQLRMIDALAENRTPLSTYQNLFKKYQTDRQLLAKLKAESERAMRESDFIQFQLSELLKAELIENEQERIEEEQTRLQNAEGIKRTLVATHRAVVDDENPILSQLQSVGQALHTLRRFSPSIAALYDRFESARLELQDVGYELESEAEATEFDPERIAEIQMRLDVIYRLQKKHSVQTVTELLEIQHHFEQQLASFGDLSDEILRLEQSLKDQEIALWAQADTLSNRRKSVVQGFESRVKSMLQQLAMENAVLKVQIDPLKELTLVGTDHVEFLFSANKGSRLNPIKDVASGGELSRLTLCTKSLVASAIPLPTLIFDEIDSGVSGDVALKMGNILQRLAAEHQVVVITHSPQVASKGHRHYFVYKKVEGERTLTNVRELKGEERVQSVAMMLSQNPPSNAAIENARELLGIPKESLFH
jgi:DNA repair protein RecN (Recombination protein N)